MNVGSLFTGIGGFDLGLERAGMRVVWQCEQDEFCRRVLARHWPGVPCCQDISLAGKGAGIDGERSGLWGEYARLVGELRPRYVIVENVAALLARGLGRVLGDLAALGYDAEWDCLPASAFGAPHRRDRLWLVAYPNGESEPGRPVDAEPGRRLVVSRGAVADAAAPGLPHGRRAPMGEPGAQPEPDGRGAGSERRRSAGGELQDADERSLQSWRVGGRAAQTGGAEWWAVEPPVGRVAHGVPDRLDQLAALGNALVPQIAEWLGRRILEAEAMSEQRAA